MPKVLSSSFHSVNIVFGIFEMSAIFEMTNPCKLKFIVLHQVTRILQLTDYKNLSKNWAYIFLLINGDKSNQILFTRLISNVELKLLGGLNYVMEISSFDSRFKK